MTRDANLQIAPHFYHRIEGKLEPIDRFRSDIDLHERLFKVNRSSTSSKDRKNDQGYNVSKAHDEGEFDTKAVLSVREKEG